LLTTTTLPNWLNNKGLWLGLFLLIAKDLRCCEKDLDFLSITESEVGQLGSEALALVSRSKLLVVPFSTFCSIPAMSASETTSEASRVILAATGEGICSTHRQVHT
jgi:hypothetical protein